MSSIVRHKVSIANVNSEVLMEAITFMAQNGEMMSIGRVSIIDKTKGTIRVDGARMTIYTQNGQLMLKADSDYRSKNAKAVKALEKSYKAIASQRALRRQKFRTEIVFRNGNPVLQGVRA